MKKLLLVLAAFAVGAAIMFGAAAVVPAGVAEDAQAAMTKLPGVGGVIEDYCACGGQINYVYHHQETFPGHRDCWYEGRAPNGTIVNYFIRTISIVQTCPMYP